MRLMLWLEEYKLRLDVGATTAECWLCYLLTYLLTLCKSLFSFHSKFKMILLLYRH